MWCTLWFSKREFSLGFSQWLAYLAPSSPPPPLTPWHFLDNCGVPVDGSLKVCYMIAYTFIIYGIDFELLAPTRKLTRCLYPSRMGYLHTFYSLWGDYLLVPWQGICIFPKKAIKISLAKPEETMGVLGVGEKKARKLTRTCGGTDFMLAIPSKAVRRGDHARVVHRTPKHFISSQSTRYFNTG